MKFSKKEGCHHGDNPLSFYFIPGNTGLCGHLQYNVRH